MKDKKNFKTLDEYEAYLNGYDDCLKWAKEKLLK